jgi:hypothetical protein
MTTDHDPEPIPGQLDVYECIELAEGEDRQPDPAPTKPLTPAEVVAKCLSERAEQ